MPSTRLTRQEKRRWVAALRSGKFRQGQFQLHRAGRYCCLGVECVVNGRHTAAALGDFGMPSQIETPKLPKPVQQALAELNDGVGDENTPARFVPFEVIAGVIDQWVEPCD